MSMNNRVRPTPHTLPELAEGDPRRYQMNMDWVWSTENNRGLTKQATVLATVSTSAMDQLKGRFDAWTEYLHGPDDEDRFVHGGWFCQRVQVDAGQLVLLFGSGGQDVAESLDYGIQWFSGAVLGAIPDTTVVWQELPLTSD
ncbi:hypothetical protein [Luteimonas mephitis]|uniref:hypothetical protein n=1 Tax=Luteimonas mephitis TaxID=83615 RepID=UPI000478B1F0|nr:hypothetical protein [Luteimonas mephitis]